MPGPSTHHMAAPAAHLAAHVGHVQVSGIVEAEAAGARHRPAAREAPHGAPRQACAGGRGGRRLLSAHTQASSPQAAASTARSRRHSCRRRLPRLAHLAHRAPAAPQSRGPAQAAGRHTRPLSCRAGWQPRTARRPGRGAGPRVSTPPAPAGSAARAAAVRRGWLLPLLLFLLPLPLLLYLLLLLLLLPPPPLVLALLLPLLVLALLLVVVVEDSAPPAGWR